MQRISYSQASDYLAATQQWLIEKELEHNLILGISNAIIASGEINPNHVFVNVIENQKVLASSMKTASRAIIANFSKDDAAIKMLAEYYQEVSIALDGVVGEQSIAKAFSKHYGKEQIAETGLLVHQLHSLNSIEFAPGKMMVATQEHFNFICGWTHKFERDALIDPPKSKDEIERSTQRWIDAGQIFFWVIDEVIVSMAAIVRTTAHVGIVGLVYTPASLRGNGYATALVHAVSDTILKQGYASCGLFTEKSNPTSNKIYHRIGYEPIAEFSEITFL